MLVVEIKNKMNVFPYVKQTSLTTSNNMRKSSIHMSLMKRTIVVLNGNELRDGSMDMNKRR